MNDENENEIYESLEKVSPLTPKQERFAQLYVKYSNASKAYREAFNSKTAKDTTVHPNASTLLANGKVSARVMEIQTELAKDFKVEMGWIFQQYGILYHKAMEKGSPASAAKILDSFAKHLGFNKMDPEKLMQAQFILMGPENERIKNQTD